MTGPHQPSWSPWKALLRGILIALAAGALFGLIGLAVLALFGDDIVAGEQAMRRQIELYGRSSWRRNYWSLLIPLPAVLVSLQTARALDRWCALGWVIEGILVALSAVTGSLLMAGLAQQIVRPWDNVIWFDIAMGGALAALIGTWESWRRGS